ncbi:hypothetical protein EQH57_0055 [Dictyocoela roeselum]|nr:hypothetical protein EQH57_0055 [Dictyocoela roeselum]
MEFNITSFYDKIFVDTDEALYFLKKYGLFANDKKCFDCKTVTLSIRKDATRINSLFYYCKMCKKKFNLTKGTIIESFKKPLNIFLRIIYGITINFDYCQMEIFTGVSPKTFLKIKKLVINMIKIKKERIFNKIGGVNIIVQVDETAICQGRIIENPSSVHDEIPGIQWLVGGVEDTTNKFCFLELVPNRLAPTLTGVFERNVREGSIIVSDGYPSYPSAIRIFGSEHKIVPHNIGFVNLEGYNTNLIENLWSHLKVEYKIRRGIQKENLVDFIFEFYFKKYFIKIRTKSSISNGFRKLLEIIFN